MRGLWCGCGWFPGVVAGWHSPTTLPLTAKAHHPLPACTRLQMASCAAAQLILSMHVAVIRWQAVYRVIPDERPLIEQTLKELCDAEGCSLVVTTGGTGPAPRDVTPEATEAVRGQMQ